VVMTVAEASKRIGISASKLYQLVSARRISHHRIDGKILFTDEDIETFLADCRVEAVVSAPPQPRLHLKHLNVA
jgi:excisionase family DNA binding protein